MGLLSKFFSSSRSDTMSISMTAQDGARLRKIAGPEEAIKARDGILWACQRVQMLTPNVEKLLNGDFTVAGEVLQELDEWDFDAHLDRMEARVNGIR